MELEGVPIGSERARLPLRLATGEPVGRIRAERTARVDHGGEPLPRLLEYVREPVVGFPLRREELPSPFTVRVVPVNDPALVPVVQLFTDLRHPRSPSAA